MRSRFNRRQDMQIRFVKAKRRSLAHAKPGVHDCIVILDGLKPDFNIGKIIRSADAFGIQEVHLVGVDFFDPEPAKGSMRWVVLHQHSNFQSCYEAITGKGYVFYCLEPETDCLLGSEPFPNVKLITSTLKGVSFDILQYPSIRSLAIPQWGHVQSLNASVAASVAMYEYVRQYGKAMDVREGDGL